MTLMLILRMQYLVSKEKLKFLILKHVKSAGEQVQSLELDQKLVQHVQGVVKLEEPLEHLLVISHR